MSILYRNSPFGAAGILPYTVHNGKIYVLLGNERRGFSDFGGYKDGPTESTEFCAAREFSEETLGLFINDSKDRGCIAGVEKSTLLFNSILTNKDLYNVGLITKIENYFNRYAMYICPINRYILDNDFRSVYLLNKEKPIKERIENTEKNHIWWFELEKLLELSLDESLKEIKRGQHIYALFGSFLKTIREPKFIEFFTVLKSSYDTNLLKSMIDDVWNKNTLL
ncbi:hypothetical protein DICPUDRAFT_78457 [Dictyostelium purpureum]|uniref:Nudix hydrolase domain-containing protein n=1 Tax=Dictyostelium purpureum TaxID=5786 RepID=F0ZJL7_DICPU|nr:uncharacterized protein DICPUDRAFT_78457 [Dictyostelium purpureum]EGC35869.1 hypothetical protein DICPUDRAFT_78457 [Dictyostelium purpureum]|eukprot:XP_003287600.1 hypothetical protein DICPUDRAFT_78457 [Dictyostelium purpureum]